MTNADPGPAFGPLPDPPADDSRYLVWSNEHCAWWGPYHMGYSKGIAGAGHYSRGAALEICRRAIPSASHSPPIAEIPVRFEDIAEFLGGQAVPACIINGE